MKTPAGVTGTVTIRDAEPRDLGRIREIYNASILKETASFYTEPRSDAQMREWFAAHDARNPVVVATDGALSDRVIGWACLSRWDERLGYATTSEFTFYVDETARGRGVGRSLLGHLDARAPALGCRTLVSRIAGESAASVKLHEAFGFRKAGVLEKVGRKFDRWLDVVFYQKVYL